VLHMCGDTTCFVCSCSVRVDRLRWPLPLFDGQFRVTPPHSRDTVQTLEDWRMLVVYYTTGHLTNERHRLPAISGLARIIFERFGWKYVAGLWSHHLEESLLWWVIEPDVSLHTNPAHYKGPSWSWASTSRQIWFPHRTMLGRRYPRSWIKDRNSLACLQDHDWVSGFEVLHSSVDLMGKDPLAEVKAGELTILGKIRPIPHPVVSDPPWESRPLEYISGSAVDMNYRPDQTRPQGEPRTNDAETRCLVAGFGSLHRTSPICYAIVLQAVTGTTNRFRRIGLVKLERSVRDGARWDEVVDWLLAAETKEIYLV
jgi:hypothetical protein